MREPRKNAMVHFKYNGISKNSSVHFKYEGTSKKFYIVIDLKAHMDSKPWSFLYLRIHIRKLHRLPTVHCSGLAQSLRTNGGLAWPSLA